VDRDMVSSQGDEGSPHPTKDVDAALTFIDSSFKFFTLNYIHLSTLRPTHDPTVHGLMMNDRSFDIVIELKMSRIVDAATVEGSGSQCHARVQNLAKAEVRNPAQSAKATL
jgi:hypothetical protein